ncbi:unnamed protein product [Hymenolepis diminuta]|uniref:Uncharacterized protein n=1 Tax=Hymenolepis diminuta TaxID=6216 RepID=A0A564Y4G0_HYMDI|nr:unnamed protein product [Hymenolepis diminuta]
MRTQRIIFAIVLFLAVTRVTYSSSLLNTRDAAVKPNDGQTPDDSEDDNIQQNPPTDEKPTPEEPDKKTEKPGNNDTDEEKTQQPGDSQTTTTSTSSHISYGLAISFTSLLISFVFCY